MRLPLDQIIEKHGTGFVQPQSTFAPPSAPLAGEEASQGGNFLTRLPGAIYEGVRDSVTPFGKGIGMSLASGYVDKLATQAQEQQSELAQRLLERINEARESGDEERVERYISLLDELDYGQDIREGFIEDLPSNREVIGSAIQTAALMSGGGLVRGAGVRSGQLATGSALAGTGARTLGGAVARAGTEAAVEGFAWGIGAGLQDEDATASEVIGEGIAAGTTSGLIGAGLVGTIGGTGLLATAAYRKASSSYMKTRRGSASAIDNARKAFIEQGGKALRSAEGLLVAKGDTPVDWTVDALRRSFLADNTGNTNAIQRIARSENMSEEELLRAFSSGPQAIPEVRGSLADYSLNAGLMRSAQEALAEEGIRPLVRSMPGRVSIDSLQEEAVRLASERATVGDVANVQSRIRKIFTEAKQRYGTDNITPEQAYETMIQMNSSSFKAAGKNLTRTQVELDSESFVGDVIRNKLTELNPELTTLNAQYGAMSRDLKIMDALNNKKIKADVFGEALGRFGGVAAGATVGLTVGGPGGLVVAGILASIGANMVSKLIRTRRFSKSVSEQLLRNIDLDPTVRRVFMDNASPRNRKFIEEQIKALPAPGESSAPTGPVDSRAIPLPGRSASSVEASEAAAREAGAISQPTSQAARMAEFSEQASRFRTKESYLNAVRSNPAWRAKIENAGLTVEEVADRVFGF